MPIPLGRASSVRAGGGNVCIDRLVGDMARLISMNSYFAVTSLVDFYGFKGKDNRTVDELTELVREGVTNRRTRGREDRIMPYIQMHEFEGLLFSDVDAFGVLDGMDSQAIDKLRSVRSKFKTPEEINDNRNTAPSKRILGVLPNYRKPTDGRFVAEKAGLETIRSACPRFNDWVGRLEEL